ncbi:MAG: esterase [Rhodospirillales bacterium]|jgi:arylformamidase|nr:esterase [Rhodospirillales bacterium]
MIYRGMDQAALDAQHDLRAAVPRFPEYAASWAARSEAARSAQECRLDIPYGDGPDETLDLFPAEPGAALVIFFHGGFWRAQDKRDFLYPAPAFLARGIAYASVDYTLAPAASIDEIVAQSRRAVAFVARNAAGLGVDPRRLFVAGHSAGGHLTAMLALTDWSVLGLAEAPMCGGCAVSGVYDLEPIRLCYLNAVLGLDAAAAARNSPRRLLVASSRAAPPLVFAVGGNETAEFRRQQDEFADAWRQRGLKLTVVSQPGEDHFSIMDRFAEPTSTLFRAVADAIPAAG